MGCQGRAETETLRTDGLTNCVLDASEAVTVCCSGVCMQKRLQCCAFLKPEGWRKARQCPYKATLGEVWEQSCSTYKYWGEFWFCLICYALLVTSVQHQQSEWVECRNSISFMTLYQCEWLDVKIEYVSIYSITLLWFIRMHFVYLFPCFCSFTLNVYLWFRIIDTHRKN